MVHERIGAEQAHSFLIYSLALILLMYLHTFIMCHFFKGGRLFAI